MGLFDNLKNRLRPAEVKTPKTSKKLIFGELGAPGTADSSGFITEDFNSKFQGSTAIDTYDEMRKTDATVHAALLALKLPLLAAPVSVIPADEENPESVAQAEFVSQNLFENMKPGFKEFLREALTHKDFGYAYFEKVFEVKEGKIMLKKLAFRQQSAHYRWMMQTHPDIPGITQILPTVTPEENRKGQSDTTPEIPMSKLVLFINNREGENWEGVSVLRSAYIHWYFKNTLYRIDGIKHERGAGILVIGLPDTSGDDDTTRAEELGKNWKLNEGTFIVKPSPEWTLDLMTQGIADQSASLVASVQHHDRQIAKNILAQFLNLGGDSSGSFALSKDQSSFFLLGLEDTANYMAEIINEQLIKELVDLNFGPQKKYPKLKFSKIGQVDIKETAEVLEKMINSGVVDLTPNLKVWAHDAFGLPELSPEEAEQREQERENKEAEEIDREMERMDAQRKADEEERMEDIDEEKQKEKELAERPFKPFRNLTFAEDRVKFAELRDFFNSTEEELKELLALDSAEQRSKIIDILVKAIQVGAISKIAQTRLRQSLNTVRELKNTSKTSFEQGKRNAANELGVSVPETKNADIQLRNARIEQAIADRNNAIETNTRNKALDLVRKGVGATAAAFALRQAFDKAANIQNSQIIGRTVASNVNAGRSLVFDKNKDQVFALQRSEILDERTCPMCLSIDGKVLTADDPFTKIDQVHTNCRGVWVAVKPDDPKLPTPKSLPQSLINKFETVDGIPTINSFNQLKKPLINKKSRVAEKVAAGTIDNPNLEK